MGLQQPGPKQTGRCWGSMGAGEREGPNGIQLWFLNQTHLEALLSTVPGPSPAASDTRGLG